jgi:predicted RNA binding protein YcfA (HicA-like mRNA interferase family)
MIFKTLNKKRLILMVCSIILSLKSYAGRPMSVDDASLVSPSSCQLETWYQKQADENQFWFVPACNVGKNLEMTVGLGSIDEHISRSHQLSVQAKTQIKALQPNHWGVGFSLGSEVNLKHPDDQSWNINVPMSMSFFDDDLLFHANLGWKRDELEQLNSTTWGLATEKRIVEPLTLTAEFYGDDRTSPFYQLGLKYKIFKDYIQFDMSYADQLSSKSAALYSVGFVFTMDGLLHSKI